MYKKNKIKKSVNFQCYMCVGNGSFFRANNALMCLTIRNYGKFINVGSKSASRPGRI